jgi:hypothetical protein
MAQRIAKRRTFDGPELRLTFRRKEVAKNGMANCHTKAIPKPYRFQPCLSARNRLIWLEKSGSQPGRREKLPEPSVALHRAPEPRRTQRRDTPDQEPSFASRAARSRAKSSPA